MGGADLSSQPVPYFTAQLMVETITHPTHTGPISFENSDVSGMQTLSVGGSGGVNPKNRLSLLMQAGTVTFAGGNLHDNNLYISGAAGYIFDTGATNTFTSADGKTVTVSGGIVTNIA